MNGNDSRNHDTLNDIGILEKLWETTKYRSLKLYARYLEFERANVTHDTYQEYAQHRNHYEYVKELIGEMEKKRKQIFLVLMLASFMSNPAGILSVPTMWE